jgi:hypothetical protein
VETFALPAVGQVAHLILCVALANGLPVGVLAGVPVAVPVVAKVEDSVGFGTGVEFIETDAQAESEIPDAGVMDSLGRAAIVSVAKGVSLDSGPQHVSHE